MPALVLTAHPQTPASQVWDLRAKVTWQSDGLLRAAFRLSGELSALRIPPRAAARRRDGLWRSTCFELFMAAPSGASYYEFNFSPSGSWAAYRFRSYRALDDQAPPIAASVRSRRQGGVLCLVALVDLRLSGPPAGRRSWRLGAAAVLESRGGATSYWALTHAGPRPDFHGAASRIARLPMQVQRASNVPLAARGKAVCARRSKWSRCKADAYARERKRTFTYVGVRG